MIEIDNLGYRIKEVGKDTNDVKSRLEVKFDESKEGNGYTWIIEVKESESDAYRDRIIISSMALIFSMCDYMPSFIVYGYGQEEPSEALQQFLYNNDVELLCVRAGDKDD